MKTETFLNYKGSRYLWVNLAFLFLLIAAYAVHRPLGGPNGGTTLGLIYGLFGTLGILYLTWFGVRKRSYSARHTNLKGCLAAHVWLGIALLVIVPLHAGFQFGPNIHTFTFAVMTLVVLSGMWGAYNYLRLAPQIEAHRGGSSIPKLLEQFHTLEIEINSLANLKSDNFMLLLHSVNKPISFSLRLARQGLPAIDGNAAAKSVQSLLQAEQEAGLSLISLVSKKRELANLILRESKLLAQLKCWLYIHIPFTCLLLLCLAIHIFSVCYYR